MARTPLNKAAVVLSPYEQQRDEKQAIKDKLSKFNFPS